jgi:ribosomal protein S18 acetylase RimI-like enzyme
VTFCKSPDEALREQLERSPDHAIKPAPMTTPAQYILHMRRSASRRSSVLESVLKRVGFGFTEAFSALRARLSQERCDQPAGTLLKARIAPMPPPTIRPARTDEYDEIARVWMSSWASTGLEQPSNFLLAKLRARISIEVEKGWSLFVADDAGTIAAMLALHLPGRDLDQLFVSPEYQGQQVGRQLLAFTREQMPDEISLRCVRENEKAWRWYERERFVFEKEAVEPMTGFVMKYYRWKKSEASD